MLSAPVFTSSRGTVRGPPLHMRSSPGAARGRRAARAALDPQSELDADHAAPADRQRKRRLIVLRHADAEPRGAPEADASRALSPRGKQEAREVARQLRAEKKWRPDIIFTSDAARTKETLAEMRAATPSLSRARVVELPELFSACNNGVDALAALSAALSRHATSEEATALLIGHNPGWEEAVALLTCAPSGGAAAEGSEGSATPSVVPMRTAQGALLLSEQRSWQQALACGWSRRGDVGGLFLEVLETEDVGDSSGAQRSSDMTDKQLRAALKMAEEAAKVEKPGKKKKNKKDKKNKGGEGSAAPLANAEAGIAGAKLDARRDAQGGAAEQKGGKQAVAAGGKASGDDAAAAAAKHDAKAVAKATASAATAELKAARRAAQEGREPTAAALATAAKAAAKAARGTKVDADISRATAELSDIALSGDGAVEGREAAAAKASAKRDKGSGEGKKGGQRRSPGPKQRVASKAGAT